jgi:ubiquitin C-terminal hydrolase
MKKKPSVRESITKLSNTSLHLIKSVQIVSKAFEEYVEMKGDTKEFVKYLDSKVKNENNSTKKRQTKQTKRSGATKTSGEHS